MTVACLVRLEVLEAIRKLEPVFPLEQIHDEKDARDWTYIHVAPRSDTHSLAELNTGLGKLAMQVCRVGKPDILSFRQSDGAVYCGRITIMARRVAILMYPRRWLAEQFSARLPCPVSQTVIPAADLEAA